MNCLFCKFPLTKSNPMSSKYAHCTHCSSVCYKFHDKMTLEDCYMIYFSTGYYPGYYTAQLMLWSNEIIIHSYVWNDVEKADKAKLFYRGQLPNNFSPLVSKAFVQRLLDLKAFL